MKLTKIIPKIKGHRQLLGSKACCLKTPSDFSPKSKLIEDLVNGQSDSVFDDFETMMGKRDFLDV